MTDMVKETAEEVKEYIVARLKVPVFFYYLLALAIWNWDIIIMILKSKLDVEVIIINIKKNYSEFSRVLLPLLIAIFSSILFPALMVLLDWTLSKVNLERIKSAKKVAEAEAEAQYDIQVKRNKTDKLKDLNEKISLQESELTSVRASNKEFEKKLSLVIEESRDHQSNLELVRRNKKLLEEEIEQIKKKNRPFDDNHVVQLQREFDNLTNRFPPSDLLKILEGTLSNDDALHLRYKDSSFVRQILIDQNFVEDIEEDEEDYDVFHPNKKLTKKGFALQFFIIGILSKKH